jgi:hypothetical protein
MEDMDMASPEPMPALVAPVLPEGQAADAGVAGLVAKTVANYAACYNEGQANGDPALYVSLQSENYWVANSGSANPYDVVANESGGPPLSVEVISVDNAMTYDDGRISGDVQVVLGGHWWAHNRMYFSLGSDLTWKLDEEAYLRPEPEGETVSVNGISIVETKDEAAGTTTYEFKFLGSPSILQTDVLVFNVTNSGAELHEAVVVQLPEGADPLGLLDGTVAFEDVVFYGGVFGIYPGQTQDLALVNMEPGTYTVLCFFTDALGTPHAVNGMIGQFEIVAPAA